MSARGVGIPALRGVSCPLAGRFLPVSPGTPIALPLSERSALPAPSSDTVAVTTATPAAPSRDNRLKMLDATIRRHHQQPDALLEVLHTAQELFGFLDRDTLRHVGHALRVPPSRVYGVATFYNFFSLKPQGRHTCVVCLGTACYVKGADAILTAVQRAQGVAVNGTTADGALSLATARCIGACGLAPVVVLDHEIAGRMTPETTLARLAPWGDVPRISPEVPRGRSEVNPRGSSEVNPRGSNDL